MKVKISDLPTNETNTVSDYVATEDVCITLTDTGSFSKHTLVFPSQDIECLILLDNDGYMVVDAGNETDWNYLMEAPAVVYRGSVSIST
tara:strand:+ start:308 stop:574 length:267 start_codon:yes stop_codon:yes gene_type:complete